MNITPEQADQWAQKATDGPWYVHTDPDGTLIHDDTGNMCIAVEPAGSDYRVADLHLAAAAPDLAQTIAGMTMQWSVEKHDGHRWSRHGGWVDPEPIARLRLRKAREDGETARLVRRLVGPVEVAE